jgi:DNA-binding response OmpR family regulator
MNKQTILLVDDTPQNLQVLYQTLKERYELYSADNGRDALALAESLHPDLILLDIMMPEMDGFEVCRIIKGNNTLKEIPVLFLTALVEESDESLGFEVGGADYIIKPFNPKIVLQRVATHLDLKLQRDLLIKSNQDLAKAMAEIKVLSGFLPICCVCKKIRDDKGGWNQLESYISKHSDVLFSHSYCPECADAMMTELEAI